MTNMIDKKIRGAKIQAMQPTIDEIEKAWTDAIYAEGIGGVQSEARAKLQKLRDAKTTWVGIRENDFRFAIDRYLA